VDFSRWGKKDDRQRGQKKLAALRGGRTAGDFAKIKNRAQKRQLYDRPLLLAQKKGEKPGAKEEECTKRARNHPIGSLFNMGFCLGEDFGKCLPKYENEQKRSLKGNLSSLYGRGGGPQKTLGQNLSRNRTK